MGMLFTGCNGSDEDTDTVVETEAETETETETEAPAEPKFLKIGGEDISKYKIVYEYNADKIAIFGVERSRWRPEYDCQQVTANRLAQIVKDTFGVELETSVDKNTTETEYEILIGNTNRAETQTKALTTLATDSFTVKMSGKKLIVCAGAGGSLYHALDKLEEFFATKVENNTYVIDDKSDFSGEYKLKKVACIGDSITEGYNATSLQYFAWAAVLGRLAWQEYVVYNYGIGGATMRTDFTDSYQTYPNRTEIWQRCLAKSKNNGFDIVLIMLGTNDSNRDTRTGDGIWTAADDTRYKNDFRSIVDQVKAGSPNAEFVLMNCPATYGSKTSYGSAHVVELQTQISTAMKNEGYNMHLFDMNAYTKKYLGSSLFPDGLHPANEGHDKMAQGVYGMLKMLAENKTDTYLKF